jgi:DNA mismatch endonuclease (patch repair protein)
MTVDPFSPEKRSWIMSRVKGKGTTPEEKLGQALEEVGAECERNVPDLPGKPDFVFRAAKLAVFVDGCFWHGCPEHCRMPRTRRDYWLRKIALNQERAQVQTKALEEMGWRSLRLWEHSVKQNSRPCVEQILALLQSDK